MTTIYIETTIPSYLASDPSRDLIIAAHQQQTHEWWRVASSAFEMFVSEAVLAEISAGDPELARRRLEIVAGMPSLMYTSEVKKLEETYNKRLGFSGRGMSDTPHFAFAVIYELDFLLTWNCAHIANGNVVRRLARVNAELDLFTPVIVTPSQLLFAEPENLS